MREDRRGEGHPLDEQIATMRLLQLQRLWMVQCHSMTTSNSNSIVSRS